jgi:hypothetical protein
VTSIPDAEEYLVGSLSLERGMRHYFVVGVDADADEAMKCGEAV